MKKPNPQQLTPRQYQIMESIWHSWCNTGMGPTIRELGRAIGVSSPNGVKNQLIALQKKGAIEITPGMDRAIWPSGIIIRIREVATKASSEWKNKQTRTGLKTTGQGVRAS